MIYVKKNDGTIEQFEDGLRQALDLDKQIQGEDFGTIYDADSLPDEDKLSLGLITQKEIDDKKKAQRIAEIKGELAQIDVKSNRPLRARAVGKATTEDDNILKDLDDQAEALRMELKSLS